MYRSLIILIFAIYSFIYQTQVSTLSVNTRFGRNVDPHTKLPTKFPLDLVKYSQVPKEGTYFTKDNIPKGLLHKHSTKRGTWGIIRVFTGRLIYSINNKGEDHYDIDVLDMYTPGMIEPQVLHEVSPLTDDVRFHVEFYRFPNTGDVDEIREGLQ